MGKENIELGKEPLTLEIVKKLASKAILSINKEALKKVSESRSLVEKKVAENKPVYGINTGFGVNAAISIPGKELKKLQVNIIRSHATGFGNPLSAEESRLLLSLRLFTLLNGHTGVSSELCLALKDLYHSEIIPLIPEKGSVGASGDLAPLAHLGLSLIGEGSVFLDGKEVEAKAALKKKGLKPYVLKEKEGLGLINGTQAMLSVGSLALHEALELFFKANKVAALSFEALRGNVDELNPLIHKARKQLGQIESAKDILGQLQGSSLLSKNTKRRFLQDPYSLRCAPQVHGASFDFLNFCKTIVERELNASTDNPLVFSKEGLILSGGNFHGEPLAISFDTAAIAVSEFASISERRLELLLNPHFSGLTPFLAINPGLESGYMGFQYLSASLVNENKVLSSPASVDSIPGNGGIEDHVSMGMTSARKLKQIVNNVKVALVLEAISAAQAITLGKLSHKLGKGTKKTFDLIREEVTPLTGDRIISEDVQKGLIFINKL